MKKITSIILFAVLACSIPVFGQAKKAARTGAKKAVAVMNFTNYGGSKTAFLSNALPESVSATLADVTSIRVVERRNLGKIINEITLEETGLIDTREISRAGRIARADYLILGSVAGTTDELIVTMKAVDVTTGQTVAGRVVKGNVGTIFDLSSQAARSMGAIISGEGIGSITISTTPSGADIYIDGMLAGRSPIVEYKVTEGTHRIRAILKEYLDYETSVNVLAGEIRNVTPILAESKSRQRSSVGIYGSYFLPIHKGLDGGPQVVLFMAQQWGSLVLQGDLGFATTDHNQKMSSVLPPYTQKMERYYDFITFHGVLTYAPFESWQYLSPYAGGVLGYTFITERTPNKLEDDLLVNNVEELDKFHRIAIGGVIGVTILPYSTV